MQSYLSGRNSETNFEDGRDSSFRPFLESSQPDPNSDITTSEVSESENHKAEIIYDEKDCPKVELLSEDGTPKKILIHLLDGRILTIECSY